MPSRRQSRSPRRSKKRRSSKRRGVRNSTQTRRTYKGTEGHDIIAKAHKGNVLLTWGTTGEFEFCRQEHNAHLLQSDGQFRLKLTIKQIDGSTSSTIEEINVKLMSLADPLLMSIIDIKKGDSICVHVDANDGAYIKLSSSHRVALRENFSRIDRIVCVGNEAVLCCPNPRTAGKIVGSLQEGNFTKNTCITTNIQVKYGGGNVVLFVGEEKYIFQEGEFYLDLSKSGNKYMLEAKPTNPKLFPFEVDAYDVVKLLQHVDIIGCREGSQVPIIVEKSAAYIEMPHSGTLIKFTNGANITSTDTLLFVDDKPVLHCITGVTKQQ